MPSRKAAVVAAVRDNRITMANALHRYQLTAEEFHPGALNVREFAQRGRDFSEYRPALLPELLGLHTEASSAWWARWGTDQQPSHSFTQAFCLAVAERISPHCH